MQSIQVQMVVDMIWDRTAVTWSQNLKTLIKIEIETNKVKSLNVFSDIVIFLNFVFLNFVFLFLNSSFYLFIV